MLKLPPPTERMSFRAMSLSDLDDMYEMLGDPEVMRHYPKVMTRAEAKGWIEKVLKRYDESGHGFYFCESLKSGKILGQCGILKQDVNGTIEIEVGYLFKKEHWHQGYATEAARTCRDFARNGFGYDRIVSLIRPENFPSSNVAKRLGAVLEKTVIWWNLPHDVWVLGR